MFSPINKQLTQFPTLSCHRIACSVWERHLTCYVSVIALRNCRLNYFKQVELEAYWQTNNYPC